MLATNPPKGERQQLITRNTQKITPADFSFTIVDKPSSSAVKTMQVAVPKKAVDRLRASPKCHSSSPSSTLIPQTRETSSYIGSVSSVAGGKDESRNFIRRKKGSCGASSSAEHREVHQLRSVPYSNRKVEKEVGQFD